MGPRDPDPPPPGDGGRLVEAGSASYLTESGPAIQVIRGVAAGAAATPVLAGPGMEATTVVGDYAIFPGGNFSDTRAGEEGATLLIFELVVAAGAEATPAA